MSWRATLATLVLVPFLVSGCWSDAPAPVSAAARAAQEKAFCLGFTQVTKAVTAGAGATKGPKAKAAIKRVQARVKALGTIPKPDGMSASAQAGVDLFVELVSDLPPDATAAQIGQLREGLTIEQKKQLAAFDDYTQEKCVTSPN